MRVHTRYQCAGTTTPRGSLVRMTARVECSPKWFINASISDLSITHPPPSRRLCRYKRFFPLLISPSLEAATAMHACRTYTNKWLGQITESVRKEQQQQSQLKYTARQMSPVFVSKQIIECNRDSFAALWAGINCPVIIDSIIHITGIDCHRGHC